MAAAETARLIASLELQDKNFTRGIKQVERGVDRVDRKLGAFSGFVNRNLGRAIDSIAVKVVGAVGTGLEELATLEDATSRVTGAIATVGKGWTLTADEIAVAANKIEADTDAAFDDKAIVAATETLIRYGKVTENNILPAMEVMTDLAARTGDVGSASTLLAKALADPAKAAGKLARAGVVLTKQQQKQIKAMVEAGDVAGAQTLLLEVLSKTTEGAAAASAGPYRDALNKLADAGEDLRRGFVTRLAPAILEVSELLTDELAKPSTMAALKDVGKEIGGALKGLIGIVKSLPWETIGASLKLAGTGAKAVLDAFLAMPSWVQAAVLTGWGLNKLTGGALSSVIGGLASGLIKGVLGINAGVVNVNGPVAGVGGAAGGAAAGAGKVARFANAVKILGAVSIAGASIVALAETWNGLQEQTTQHQQEVDAKVAATADQNFRETIANLRSVVAGVNAQNDLQKALTPLVAGGQLTADFEMAADRIVNEQGLTRSQTITALNALKEAQKLGAGVLKTPKLDAAILALERRLAGKTPPGTSMGGAPGAFRPTQAQKEQTAKIQAVKNAVKNAQSIASRENSAQKQEIARTKQAAATAGRTTTAASNRIPPAVRSNAVTVAASMSAAASRIVTAVNSLDLSVNVTTVNRTSTINNRYGPAGGSSTTNRSGELE